MPKELPEAEYRFDLVDPTEWEVCLTWESIREFCRLDHRTPPPPWRKLDPKQKKGFSFICKVDAAQVDAIPHPVVFWNQTRVSRSDATSLELVHLPPVPLNWARTDPEIKEAVAKWFATWLEGQRKTNPKARQFPATSKIGRRQDVLGILADLAIYRLARGQFSEAEIDDKLQGLYSKIDPKAAANAAKQGTLIKSGKVANRNLSHTCSRAEKALAGFRRAYSAHLARVHLAETLRILA